MLYYKPRIIQAVRDRAEAGRNLARSQPYAPRAPYTRHGRVQTRRVQANHLVVDMLLLLQYRRTRHVLAGVDLVRLVLPLPREHKVHVAALLVLVEGLVRHRVVLRLARLRLRRLIQIELDHARAALRRHDPHLGLRPLQTLVLAQLLLRRLDREPLELHGQVEQAHLHRQEHAQIHAAHARRVLVLELDVGLVSSSLKLDLLIEVMFCFGTP